MTSFRYKGEDISFS